MPEAAPQTEAQPARAPQSDPEPGAERAPGVDHQDPPGRRRPSHWGPPIWAGIWAAVNLALGVVLAYPFLFLLLIGIHARAMLFDRPDSPFSNNEIQGGEADGAITLGIIGAVVILAIVTAINWPLIRRLQLPNATAKAGIVVVTGALLIAPALVIF